MSRVKYAMMVTDSMVVMLQEGAEVYVATEKVGGRLGELAKEAFFAGGLLGHALGMDAVSIIRELVDGDHAIMQKEPLVPLDKKLNEDGEIVGVPMSVTDDEIREFMVKEGEAGATHTVRLCELALDISSMYKTWTKELARERVVQMIVFRRVVTAIG